MKRNNKICLKWKDILRWALLVLCGSILGVNVYLANANSLVGNKLPMPFGYGAAIVLSGSMEPELSKGDLIIVKETDTLAIDDIVVFQDKDSLIVHRIVAMDEESVTTKGDANDSWDVPVARTLVKGKVIYWNALVGRLVSFLKTPVGTICLIVASIALVEIPHRKEKEKDDEERRKLLEEIKNLREQL